MELRLQSIAIYMLMIISTVVLQRRAIVLHNNTQQHIGQNNILTYGAIIAISLLFALISGVRYDVGTDWSAYLGLYTSGDIFLSSGIEPLFAFFSKLLYISNLHVFFFFAFWAFVQFFFITLYFREEKYIIALFYFFFITTYEYISMMNIIRAATAMSIWLYSTRYIIERRPVPYFIFCAVAFLLHRSSIYLVLFYPILSRDRDYLDSVKLQLYILVAVLVCRILFVSLFEYIKPIITFFQHFFLNFTDRYVYYTIGRIGNEMNIKTSGTGIGYIIKAVIYVIIVVNSKKLKAFYATRRFQIIYFFFFLGVVFTYIFPPQLILLSRPFRYFEIFLPIMLAYYTFYLFKTRQRLYAQTVMAVLLLIFVYGQLTMPLDSHSLYQFYFQHNINYHPNGVMIE